MPAFEQGTASDRYTLIPRTAIFVREGDRYLLMKGAPSKRLWAGKYNGLGGHIERGEDVLMSAHREFREETGLQATLWLCGTVLVDAGITGVGLYVLTGEVNGGTPKESAEGKAEWIPIQEITSLPTVEDVPVLLERIHKMRRGDSPFSARSYYDDRGRLQLLFTN